MSHQREASGMGLVWKRLQRVNKHAAKFQFTVSYHQLSIIFDSKWVPHKLSVVWSRKSRRIASRPVNWESTLQDPYKGLVIWPVPESYQVAITMFKDLRSNILEEKNWSFIIEDVSEAGKRRALGIALINMSRYASVDPTASEVQVVFKPVTKKLISASLSLSFSCVLLKEGRAIDEDMQSMASFMSGNNNCDDIAPLDDFEDNSLNLPNVISESSFDEITSQLQQMTSSLSNFDVTTSSNSSCAKETLPIIDKGDVDYLNATTNQLFTKSIRPPESNAFSINEIDNYSSECLTVLDGLVDIHDSDNGDGFAEGDDPVCGSQWQEESEKTFRVTSTAQELLEWCTNIAKNYPGLKITNLTTSWRNGIGFCAIIHYHAPHMIDFAKLVPHDVKGNCKVAFEAGDKLHIPRVIQPSDMYMCSVPDKLAVMTYLHQLRRHFVNQAVGAETSSLNPKIRKTFNTQQNWLRKHGDEIETKNIDSNKDHYGQQYPETTCGPFADVEPSNVLLTLEGVTQADVKQNITSEIDTSSMENGGSLEPKIYGEKDSTLLSRELAQLFSVQNPLTADLKKKARKFLMELHQNGSTGDSKIIGPEAIRNLVNSEGQVDRTNSGSGEVESPLLVPDNKVVKDLPNQHFFKVEGFSLEEDSMEMNNDVINLIHKEMEDSEKQQVELDKQASELEKRLREVMNPGSNNTEEEEKLMAQWFIFVNKKNALLRRQMQLNILEKQAELENRFKKLNRELQTIATIEDWRKTAEQKAREQALLGELVQIVDKRDELVHQLDNQERAIEDDDLIEQDLSHLELQPKDNCVIQ